MQLTQMRQGFAVDGQSTLHELATEDEKVNKKRKREDSSMQPIKKTGQGDIKNRKVREFMRLNEVRARKKIEEHNINNLTAGGDDFKEFEDIDLKADVVDERIEQ